MYQKLVLGFTTPIVDSENQQRQVNLLRTVLIYIEIICLLFVVWDLSNGFEFEFFIFVFFVACVAGILHLLLNRGYQKVVGWALPSILIAATTSSIISFGSLRDVSLTAYFFILILTALSVGEVATVVYGGVILALTSWIYFAEASGQIQSLRVNTELFDLGIVATTLLITVFLLLAAVRQITLGLNRAYDHAKELDTLNTELKKKIAEHYLTETRLQGILDHSPAPIFIKSMPDGKYRVANKVAQELTGDGEILGKSDADVFPKDVANSLYEVDSRIAEHQQAETLEEFIILPNGKRRDFLSVKFPLQNEKGEVISVGGISLDITERKRAEDAIRNLNIELEKRVAERTSELETVNKQLQEELTERARAEDALKQNQSLLQDIMDNTSALIIAKTYKAEARGKYLFVNQPYASLFGSTTLKLQGKTAHDIYPKEIAEILDEDDRLIFETRTIKQVQEKIEVAHRERILLSNKFPLQDLSGTPYGMCIVATDITELKQAEEQIQRSLQEKETLLREIHHRVKNNLQIISSLLYLQSQSNMDAEFQNALRESRDRVESMSLIHEKLYQSPDLGMIPFSEYIVDLVKSLFRSYGIDETRVAFVVEASEIVLNINQAVPCGLIINEIVSNSLKHAFPDKRKGTLRINLSIDSNHTYSLTLSDDGVGLPADFEERSRHSLGIKLVKRLVDQIEGDLQRTSSGKGTTYQIVFARNEDQTR